jgi:CheY-like chemotaxis protein
LQEKFIAIGMRLQGVMAMPDKKHKILVVDDEQTIASTLATILESQDYKTASAFSGEEAVQLASLFQPDCVVSDVMMGAMNGIEAAIVILGSLPQCKVLFVSGNAPCLELLGDATAKGFDFDVLQKPVPVPELLARIAQLLSSPAEPVRKPAASESSACMGTPIKGSRLVG